jgi:hypothetical protein
MLFLVILQWPGLIRWIKPIWAIKTWKLPLWAWDQMVPQELDWWKLPSRQSHHRIITVIAVQMLQGERNCVTVWTPIREYGRVMLMVYGLCRYKEWSNLHGDSLTGSRSQTGKWRRHKHYTPSTMSCCHVSSLPRLIPFFFPPFFFGRETGPLLISTLVEELG